MMKYILFEEIEKTDLYHLFNIINVKYFDNEVKPVTIKWSTSKAHGGRTTYFVKSQIIEIEISKFYEVSYEELVKIMAHEMIHVILFQQNEFKDSHGSKFKAYISKIKQKGLDVPLEHDANFNSVNQSVKSKSSKTWLFIIKLSYKPNYTLAVYSGKTMNLDFNALVDKLYGLDSLIVAETDSLTALKFKAFRTISSFGKSMYKLTPELEAELMPTLKRPYVFEYKSERKD